MKLKNLGIHIMIEGDILIEQENNFQYKCFPCAYFFY